jgi:hypothetical protein
VNNRDQRLTELLADLKRQDRDAQPSNIVEQVVMRRWDALVATRPRPSRAVFRDKVVLTRRARRGASRVTVAAAGVMAASAALLVLFGRPTAPPVEPSQTVGPVEQPVISTTPRVEAVSSQAGEPAGRRRLASSNQARTRRIVPSAVVEPSVTFEGLGPLDAEQFGAVRMMRVRLTSGAASSLGLADASWSGDGYVQADVLVGEDGLARAIRLVHQP